MLFVRLHGRTVLAKGGIIKRPSIRFSKSLRKQALLLRKWEGPLIREFFW
jgi:hypothetical protein